MREEKRRRKFERRERERNEREREKKRRGFLKEVLVWWLVVEFLFLVKLRREIVRILIFQQLRRLIKRNITQTILLTLHLQPLKPTIPLSQISEIIVISFYSFCAEMTPPIPVSSWNTSKDLSKRERKKKKRETKITNRDFGTSNSIFCSCISSYNSLESIKRGYRRTEKSHRRMNEAQKWRKCDIERES